MMKNYFLSILIFLFVPIITNAQSGWVTLNSGTSANLNGVACMSSAIVFIVGDGLILHTTDGGATWDSPNIGTTQNLNSISITNNGNVVVAGDAGTILLSTDSGSNWQSITSNVTDDLLSVSFNGTNGVAGGTSQTIIYSTDSGASWSTSQSGFFGGGFYGTQMFNSGTSFVAGENSIFQPMFGNSTDGGQSWNFTAFYLNSNEGQLYGIHFFDMNNGVASAGVFTGEGAICTTSDAGTTWTTQPFFSNALYALDFPATQIGYSVGVSGIIIKSSDGGNSWETLSGGTSNNLNDLSFADELNGYIVGDNGTVLKTTSGGVIPVELTSFSVSLNENNVKLFWETSTETNNSGFYIQRKSKRTWENLNFIEGNGTTIESHSYYYIDNLSDLNYSGNIYYRLKQVDYDGSIENSATKEIFYNPKPDEFSLEQNYPNPFNPTTLIKFSLPEGTNVKLTIYDLLGNEIKILVDEFKPAGTYSEKFDGANLTSGIYIYRLQAGEYVSTKRMVLIK
jgi:photosystem II stability/assembly factor-like uncharacterized protein